MSRIVSSRVCSILLLLTLLGSPAFAYGSRSIRPAPEPATLFTWLWQALSELVPAIAESHAGMDPDGTPASTVPGTDDGDGRIHIDPNG